MSDAVVALERAEIDAFADLYRAASPDVVEAADLAVSNVGDVVVLSASRIDVLAVNRALGLGLHEPVWDRLLADLLAVLAERGSPRFFIPIAPVNGHERVKDALVLNRIRHYNNWVRLSRHLRDIPVDTSTDLDVREIDRASADLFGQIVATAFGYPPPVALLPGQTVGRPGWRHYLAYAGTRRSRRRRCMCPARPPGSDSLRPTRRTESAAPSGRLWCGGWLMLRHSAARA